MLKGTDSAIVRASIGSSLKLWLDASDLSTITESGGAVSQWSDKSGNGNHATQGTGAAQPLTNANTMNGKNVITFDSTDDWLAANGVATVGEGDRTVFIVAKPTTQVDIGVMTAFQKSPDAGDTDQSKLEITTAGDIQHTTLTSEILDTRDWTDTPFVLSTTSAGTVGNARVNGAAADTNPTYTSKALSSSGFFNIGQELDAASPSNFYGGDIAEILIYNRILSALEIQNINNELLYNWGITPA